MNRPDRKNLLCDVNALYDSLHEKRLRIIDCRFDLMDPHAGRKAYLQGHIPGAVYADLDTDLAAPVDTGTGRHPLPAVAAITETFRRLGISADTRVVVYDSAGGAIAARAWWLLRWLGHTQVTLLDGGLPAWERKNLPLEPGEHTVGRGDFVAAPRDELVLTTAELMAQFDRIGDFRIVDARDRERYRGETEPIDTVAGHIPGTLNLPFADALTAEGGWMPGTRLPEVFRGVLGEARDAPWAVMCGSGVTACHLAVSGLLAGYAEPRLYVGSWSEWIRDPERPVATGPA